MRSSVPIASKQVAAGSGTATAVISRMGRALAVVKSLELKVKPTDELAAVRKKLTSPPLSMSFRKLPGLEGKANVCCELVSAFMKVPSDTSLLELRIDPSSL